MELTNKVDQLQEHLSKTEDEKAEMERNVLHCKTRLCEIDEQMEQHKQNLRDSQNQLEEKEKAVMSLKDLLQNTQEQLTQQIQHLNDKCQLLEKEKDVKDETSQRRHDELVAEIKCLEEKLSNEVVEHQKLQQSQEQLQSLLNEEKGRSNTLHALLEKLQADTQAERCQLEGELEEALEELSLLETKELNSEEIIRRLEEQNEQRAQEILCIHGQLNRKTAEIEEMFGTNQQAMTKLKEDLSNSLRKIGDMATDMESTKKSMTEDIRCLEDRNHTLEAEIMKLTKQLEEEQTHGLETRQSQHKAKEEYARMLLDVQTKLAQKDSELRKALDSHALEVTRLQEQMENQSLNFQRQLKEAEDKCAPVVDLSEVQHWRSLYEQLYAKVKPFQQQLDGFEAERKALLNENGAAQGELNKLADAYAQLLGHQNQKQKIKHVVKLKEENLNLKQEVSKLKSQTWKLKKDVEELKQNQGQRRFDPSKAFQHDSKENIRPSTPLREGNRIMF
ncbi:HMMR protein, partial [Amia calva]|nr:HMMR protein [Amia calva]